MLRGLNPSVIAHRKSQDYGSRQDMYYTVSLHIWQRGVVIVLMHPGFNVAQNSLHRIKSTHKVCGHYWDIKRYSEYGCVSVIR